MEEILFNKNHIKVSWCPSGKERWSIAWATGNSETIYPKGMTITIIAKKYETVVKESPLGFYYKSIEENAIIDGMNNSKECIRRCKYRKKKNYNTKPYNEAEEIELDKLNEEILKEANVEKC